MSGAEAAAMPHTEELEGILRQEQHNLVPKIIESLEKQPFSKWRADQLTKQAATESSVKVAQSIAYDVSTDELPQDSYHIHSAARELYAGSYWHALTHIEKISDDKKEMREKLGKIAIEQCFYPNVYCWGKVHRENEWGAFEILERIVANKDSKLKNLISVQDFDRCVDEAFTSFVKHPNQIKPFPFAWSIKDPNNWLFRSFSYFLGHTEFLDKERVIKTLESNPDFSPGNNVYLYANYIFKRFEEDWNTTEEERAKIFWPVLKSILWPREEYDVFEDDEKLLHEKIKYARSDYCMKKTETEIVKILEHCCEDTWQSMDFANTILGKKKATEILEGVVRNARGENAMELIERTIAGDFQKNINISLLYVMKSHCFPKNEDGNYDAQRKRDYAKSIDKMERILSKKK